MPPEPVNRHTAYSTVVHSLQDAFTFVFECLEKDGIPGAPEIRIDPFTSMSADDIDTEAEYFSVTVAGDVEESRRPPSPQVGRPRDDEAFSDLSDVLAAATPGATVGIDDDPGEPVRMHVYTGDPTVEDACTLEVSPLTPCGMPYFHPTHRGHRPDGEDCGFEICGGGRFDPCSYNSIQIREFTAVADEEFRRIRDGE